MIREWRNADHVRINMEFQEEISSAMQKKWFEKIQDHSHQYFVIRKEEKAIGLIHVKEIDWGKKVGESGIFIGDQAFLNTSTPLFAIMSLMDGVFRHI